MFLNIYVSDNSVILSEGKTKEGLKGSLFYLEEWFSGGRASRICWVLYEISNLFRGGLKLEEFAFCVCVR